MRHHSRRWILFVLVALVVFAPLGAAAFSDLYIFGDSIVDQGNTQASVLAAGGPDVAPASAGYFQGRFTNGIHSGDVLNQFVEGTNSQGFLSGGDNYAFGGARARADVDLIPDLVAQVGAYSLNVSGVSDPQALYLINAGGNDIRDIVQGGLTGSARQDVIDDAVVAIATSVSALKTTGAQHIIVAGVGDVGGIPETLALGGAASAEGRAASEEINAKIAAAIGGQAIFVDVLAISDGIGADPTAFGLPSGINVTDACLFSGSAPPAGPPTCEGFAFFDPVHPTTAIHQIVGEKLVEAAIPEPGAAVLFLFALLGVAAYQRRRSGPRPGRC